MGGSNGAAGKGLGGLILVLVAGVVALGYLLFKVFTSGSGVDFSRPTMTASAVNARIAQVGTEKVVEGGAPGTRSGQAVYESLCFSCHATGAQGAPKFEDVAAWSSRIAKGFDTLSKHAIEGFNAMPARGGGADLTDDEVKRAVAFMANKAGASFEEPKVASGAVAAADPATKGKEIYGQVCMACHATGVSGAPKPGDKAAWAPRIKDVDAMIANVTKNAKNAMPAKGGYQGSDEEFKAAALYMINQSK
ncbi:c-type cytochrome [Chitinilyticum litopenaei]|uniref:c-type cytochrome n=1 Tax=Chitinilyticum litopenaei TaxID=1121276 RepID=UPI00048CA6E7|nr:c-type cytochrome [Chitinilyticum litopenaei]